MKSVLAVKTGRWPPVEGRVCGCGGAVSDSAPTGPSSRGPSGRWRPSDVSRYASRACRSPLSTDRADVRRPQLVLLNDMSPSRHENDHHARVGGVAPRRDKGRTPGTVLALAKLRRDQMATNRTDRELEATGTDDARVTSRDREYAPGEDPVADTDPNAEDASPATDGTGLDQVDELRREAEEETARYAADSGKERRQPPGREDHGRQAVRY